MISLAMAGSKAPLYPRHGLSRYEAHGEACFNGFVKDGGYRLVIVVIVRLLLSQTVGICTQEFSVHERSFPRLSQSSFVHADLRTRSQAPPPHSA
jgi:hypothetical protein